MAEQAGNVEWDTKVSGETGTDVDDDDDQSDNALLIYKSCYLELESNHVFS